MLIGFFLIVPWSQVILSLWYIMFYASFYIMGGNKRRRNCQPLNNFHWIPLFNNSNQVFANHEWLWVITLRPRQNGRRFADGTFKRIFVNENVRILIEISLKFVPKGPISNNPTLVQIMAWRRPGDKPLSEPMMVSLLTHICVTRPQWVNSLITANSFSSILI